MPSWSPIVQDGAVRLWACVMLIALVFLIAGVAPAKQRTALLIALLVALTPVALLPNLT